MYFVLYTYPGASFLYRREPLAGDFSFVKAAQLPVSPLFWPRLLGRFRSLSSGAWYPTSVSIIRFLLWCVPAGKAHHYEGQRPQVSQQEINTWSQSSGWTTTKPDDNHWNTTPFVSLFFFHSPTPNECVWMKLSRLGETSIASQRLPAQGKSIRVGVENKLHIWWRNYFFSIEMGIICLFLSSLWIYFSVVKCILFLDVVLVSCDFSGSTRLVRYKADGSVRGLVWMSMVTLGSAQRVWK